MMRMLACVLAMATLAVSYAEEDGDLEDPPIADVRLGEVAAAVLPAVLPAGFSAPAEVAGASQPGRDAPVSPAREAVYVFVWENYHSVVVVGPGEGVVRPAIVITYQGMGDMVAVAYRAMAFRDTRGALHIDARNALLIGPQSRHWSPDSFLFLSPSIVTTLDDANRAQRGVLTRIVEPGRPEYQDMLRTAEAIVAGSS
ncbi:MAG: hypothetical protein H0V44_03875 [Planctomycetes bacterium]|nr:hypothetical protein [Planctomycetota bacterium]